MPFTDKTPLVLPWLPCLNRKLTGDIEIYHSGKMVGEKNGEGVHRVDGELCSPKVGLRVQIRVVYGCSRPMGEAWCTTRLRERCQFGVSLVSDGAKSSFHDRLGIGAHGPG